MNEEQEMKKADIVNAGSPPVSRAYLRSSSSGAGWARRDAGQVGLSEGFRQPRGKPEGPQHFAFPEVSRETRGCLVLHSVSLEFPSGNSRVSLSLKKQMLKISL